MLDLFAWIIRYIVILCFLLL
uniref:Uncharacterized protein n=1 Tax=Arundo donax TaxID=35708 RepID=A0A0A9EIU5_ARUDO